MGSLRLRIASPHSLGKLIEWKHLMEDAGYMQITAGAPHSLGKLIEWKPAPWA